jgi:hypothetical protein
MNLIGSWGIKRAGAAFQRAFATAASKGPGTSGVGEQHQTASAPFCSLWLLSFKSQLACACACVTSCLGHILQSLMKGTEPETRRFLV